MGEWEGKDEEKEEKGARAIKGWDGRAAMNSRTKSWLERGENGKRRKIGERREDKGGKETCEEGRDEEKEEKEMWGLR